MNASRQEGAEDANSVKLKLFQALTGILALILAAWAGFYFYKQHLIQPISIDVNGRQIVVVENLAAARRIYTAALAAGLGSEYASNKRTCTEKVTFVTSPQQSGVALSTEEDAASLLAKSLHVTVNAAGIYSNGKLVAALPNLTDASQALQSVKDHYVKVPPVEPLASDPVFRDKVALRMADVPVRSARKSVADAVLFLCTPPPAHTYTVRQHDTGWTIARKFHMTWSDFLATNAGRDLNRLAIGDEVRVSQSSPPMVVIVRKLDNQEEPIRKGSRGDAAGKREVTVVTTYINGARVGPPETVSSRILERAHALRVLD